MLQDAFNKAAWLCGPLGFNGSLAAGFSPKANGYLLSYSGATRSRSGTHREIALAS
jgi:hypothetical protein